MIKLLCCDGCVCGEIAGKCCCVIFIYMFVSVKAGSVIRQMCTYSIYIIYMCVVHIVAMIIKCNEDGQYNHLLAHSH